MLIGSGEEYGVLPENTSLVSETTPVHPANPYAITKLAQNLFGELYAKAYDMHIMMVRAFNHIGPDSCPSSWSRISANRWQRSPPGCVSR